MTSFTEKRRKKGKIQRQSSGWLENLEVESQAQREFKKKKKNLKDIRPLSKAEKYLTLESFRPRKGLMKSLKSQMS